MPAVYIIGSLRNPRVPEIAKALRLRTGFDVFDDWYAAGPNADDHWRDYEQARGHTLVDALKGHSARHVYHYDKAHLDRCDFGVLVLPAGRSGHLELGYMAGQGKRTAILMDGEPERYDVMYQFADRVVTDVDNLVAVLYGFHAASFVVP